MGDNEYGELGLPDSKFHKDPIKITFFEDKKLGVKKVTSGSRHSIVLTDNNKLYAFGDNSESQCSGTLANYPTPTKVKFLGKDKIVEVYAGYNHTVALTDKGDVYSWGDTSSGKLGYITGLSTQNTPKIIPFLKCKNISHISTGPIQTALVTSHYDESLLGHYNTIPNS